MTGCRSATVCTGHRSLLAVDASVEPLPEEVRRFLFESIHSVDQLEILRVLGEQPDREWAAAILAQEVQIKPQDINVHIQALQGRGLLSAETREGTQFCRYGPASAELQGRLSQLLQAYRERPVTMINLVYARATEALKTFAEAFRIRKEG